MILKYNNDLLQSNFHLSNVNFKQGKALIIMDILIIIVVVTSGYPKCTNGRMAYIYSFYFLLINLSYLLYAYPFDRLVGLPNSKRSAINC